MRCSVWPSLLAYTVRKGGKDVSYVPHTVQYSTVEGTSFQDEEGRESVRPSLGKHSSRTGGRHRRRNVR